MQTARTLCEAMQAVLSTYGLSPLEDGELYACLSGCGYEAESPSMKECITELSSSGTAKEIYDVRESTECQRLSRIIIGNFLKKYPGLDKLSVNKAANAILMAAGVSRDNLLEDESLRPKKKSHAWAWLVCIALAAALAAGGYFAYPSLLPQQHEEETILSEIAWQLEGAYTVRLTDQDQQTSILTGEVTKLTADSYSIYIVTEYGPQYITFSIDNDLHVHSNQLGDGDLRYRKDLHKTTITFKHSGSTCELSK